MTDEQQQRFVGRIGAVGLVVVTWYEVLELLRHGLQHVLGG